MEDGTFDYGAGLLEAQNRVLCELRATYIECLSAWRKAGRLAGLTTDAAHFKAAVADIKGPYDRDSDAGRLCPNEAQWVVAAREVRDMRQDRLDDWASD